MYLDKPVTGRTQPKRTFSGFKTAVLKADARPLQRDVHTVLRLQIKKNKLSKIYTDNSEDWYLPRLLTLFSSQRYKYMYKNIYTHRVRKALICIFCSTVEKHVSTPINLPANAEQ